MANKRLNKPSEADKYQWSIFMLIGYIILETR